MAIMAIKADRSGGGFPFDMSEVHKQPDKQTHTPCTTCCDELNDELNFQAEKSPALNLSTISPLLNYIVLQT